MADQIRTNLSTLQSYDKGLVKAGGGEVNRSARCLCNEGLIASEQLLARRHHFVTLHKLWGKRETDKSGNITSPSEPKKETTTRKKSLLKLISINLILQRETRGARHKTSGRPKHEPPAWGRSTSQPIYTRWSVHNENKCSGRASY